MLLVIDIGNTSLVLGIFEGDNLSHSCHMLTRPDQSVDEYALLFRKFFEFKGISHDQVSGIVISSVVPTLDAVFELLSNSYFGVQPLFVDAAEQDLMPVLYSPPSDVGADRIVTGVAAFRLTQGPTIVVDFGTATTFDAISAKGEYLGGNIVPGIGILSEVLYRRTEKLPRVEIKKPSKVIGNSTVESMQAGIYFGYVGLVKGILQGMKRELGDCQVVATGGHASIIAADCSDIDRLEEDLIIQGLNIFYSHLKYNK